MFSLATVTLFANSLLAQTPATPPTSGPSAPWYVALFQGPTALLMAMAVLMYVFIFSSKRKQEKKKRDLLGAIKRGDRVQTIGGILGKVVEADDAKVLLKVDESSNTKIWFSRGAIATVLGEEKAAEVPAK